VCLTVAEVFRLLRTTGEPLPETGVKYAQFSLVGISNAMVDLGVWNLLLLIYPTRRPEILVLYNLVALALTNANSYLWNTLWTFRHHARHDAKQVGAFGLQAAEGIGVSSIVLWLVAHGLVVYANFPPLIGGNVAKLSSMLLGSTTSFLLLHFHIPPRVEERGKRPAVATTLFCVCGTCPRARPSRRELPRTPYRNCLTAPFIVAAPGRCSRRRQRNLVRPGRSRL
jgi:putative flippase GtrA